MEASYFSGEGYRKVWAPRRPVQRDAHPHDGKIVTEIVDQVWGTDMTQTVTTGEGRTYVFIALDHCSGEFVGTHCAVHSDVLRKVTGGLPIRMGALCVHAGYRSVTTTARIAGQPAFDNIRNIVATLFQPPAQTL